MRPRYLNVNIRQPATSKIGPLDTAIMPGTSASFLYFQWQDVFQKEKPFELFIDLPPDLPDPRRTNLVFEGAPEEFVEDTRGSEEKYSLDTHGFTFRKHKTTFDNWSDREAVEREHFPEIEQLLKDQVDGVDRVFFFDWRVRLWACEKV
jgi:hypothetical protein